MKLKALAAVAVSTGALGAGGASAAEKTFNVDGFTSVSVSAGIEAEIAVGPAASARAEGSDEGIDNLEVFVEGDQLVIRRTPRSGYFNWGRNHRVTVYVTTPSLDGIDVSSGAEARATGIKAAMFSAEASSGASAALDGDCEQLSADVSSGASLNADRLVCQKVNADASSGASARVHATEALVADASSGGSVRVSGSPSNVDIDESSGGDVSVMR